MSFVGLRGTCNNDVLGVDDSNLTAHERTTIEFVKFSSRKPDYNLQRLQ